MIKWLLVIGVVAAVYYFFIKKKPAVTTTATSSNPKTSSAKQDAEEMVQCVSCSVYVELEETILSNGKYYCSKECVQKG